MSRQLRYPLPGVPQHILQWGHNRQPTFFKDIDYGYYLDCLREAAARHECAVHAYVLMTNHVHLLVTPSHAQGIARFMQSVGRCYVRFVNDTYRRSGTLWEARYKACPVDAETYVLACYRYLEMNPVRARLVSDARDYPWSSYACHALGRNNPVITYHARYVNLGRTDREREQTYAALCRRPLDDALLWDIRETTRRCLVLGTDRFKDHVEQILSRPVRPGRVGRPRKELTI